MSAVNSLPLSDCRIIGAPNTVKISYKNTATSDALLLVKHLAHKNLVKWSQI